MSRGGWGRTVPADYVPPDEELILGLQYRIAEALEALETIASRLVSINKTPTPQPVPVTQPINFNSELEKRTAATFGGWAPANSADPILDAQGRDAWETLGIMPHVYYRARNRGVLTIRQLLTMTADDVEGWAGIGPVKVRRLRESLKDHGLHLAGDSQ